MRGMGKGLRGGPLFFIGDETGNHGGRDELCWAMHRPWVFLEGSDLLGHDNYWMILR